MKITILILLVAVVATTDARTFCLMQKGNIWRCSNEAEQSDTWKFFVNQVKSESVVVGKPVTIDGSFLELYHPEIGAFIDYYPETVIRSELEKAGVKP